MGRSLWKTAAAPALAAGIAALLLFASAGAGIAAMMDGITTDGGTEEDDQRFVRVLTVYRVDPGDHMRVGMQWSDGLDPVLANTRVLVVEGGEGQAYFEGREAAHVLFETQYPEADTLDLPPLFDAAYGPLQFRFVRPDIYEGKPHEQGLNGDLHDAVDLVVVAERPEGMAAATWQAGVRGLHDADPSIQKADGAWVTLQIVLLAASALSALAALVAAGAWWMARSGRGSGTDDGEGEGHAGGMPGLVTLQGKAERFLAQLRTTMALAGGLLAAGGLGLLASLSAVLDTAEYTPYDGLDGVALMIGIVLWALGLLVWWVQYRAIARELRRWGSRAPPLDA